MKAPVFYYVCPKCLANMGNPCVRVRKVKRPAPEVLLYAHKERYAVWRAWEQPEFSFDNVRGIPYKNSYQPLESAANENIRNFNSSNAGSRPAAAGGLL